MHLEQSFSVRPTPDQQTQPSGPWKDDKNKQGSRAPRKTPFNRGYRGQQLSLFRQYAQRTRSNGVIRIVRGGDFLFQQQKELTMWARTQSSRTPQPEVPGLGSNVRPRKEAPLLLVGPGRPGSAAGCERSPSQQPCGTATGQASSRRRQRATEPAELR